MQEGAGGRRGGLGALAWLLGVAGLAALADLLSKSWVFAWWQAQGFRVHNPPHAIGSLPLDLIDGYLALFVTLNPRGVFSFGPTAPAFFVLFSLVVIGVILWMWHGYGRSHPLLIAALGLVLGGAIGNLWDRIRHGAVRDFIDFHIRDRFRWPAFNGADVFICVGAGLLLLYVLLHPQPRDTKSAEGKPADRPRAPAHGGQARR